MLVIIFATLLFTSIAFVFIANVREIPREACITMQAIRRKFGVQFQNKSIIVRIISNDWSTCWFTNKHRRDWNASSIHCCHQFYTKEGNKSIENRMRVTLSCFANLPSPLVWRSYTIAALYPAAWAFRTLVS